MNEVDDSIIDLAHSAHKMLHLKHVQTCVPHLSFTARARCSGNTMKQRSEHAQETIEATR